MKKPSARDFDLVDSLWSQCQQATKTRAAWLRIWDSHKSMLSLLREVRTRNGTGMSILEVNDLMRRIDAVLPKEKP